MPVVAQMAQALAGLSAGSGLQNVTVQLAPAELGQIRISVVHARDGTASVTVTAVRPTTLALVQADSSQLHAALDKAGVMTQGRTLTLQLDSTDPTATGPRSGAAAASGGSAHGSTDGSAPRNSPAATDPAQHRLAAAGPTLTNGSGGSSQLAGGGEGPGSQAARFVAWKSGNPGLSEPADQLADTPANPTGRNGVDITA
jgi:hypothetical protein